MRRMSVSELRPGMVLARDVPDGRGGILLRRGVQLNEAYIRSLVGRGYSWVYVSDDAADAIVVEELIQAYVRGSVPGVLRSLCETISPAGDEPGAEDAQVDYWTEMIEASLQEALSPEVVTVAARMAAFDVALLNHGVEVAAVALWFAKRLGFGARSLIGLARGCLLHDCGKSGLGAHLSILPLLSDEQLQELQRHPLAGLHMVRETRVEDETALDIIVQHHERQDGLGYPRGLRGSNAITGERVSGYISLAAELASIADAFVMISALSLRQPPLPAPLIRKLLREMAGPILNRELVSSFLAGATQMLIGLPVLVLEGKLAGQKGTIVRRNDAQGTITVRLESQGAGQLRAWEVELPAAPGTAVEAMLV